MSDPNNTATITPEPPAAPAAPPMLPATVPQQDCPLTFNTKAGLEALQRAGKLFSSSPLVPKEYQGPDGLASCCIALDLAVRLNANPLMVMQNLYIVHGRPGWSSKFLIATFNQCGKFSPIRYRFQSEEGKDEWGARAWAVDLRTGEELVGPLVTIKIAKAEGWYGKSGSKWQTMPEQMLRYRSASWLINTTAPELSMGLPMADELEDIEGEVLESSRKPALPAAALPALAQPQAALPAPAAQSQPATTAPTGSGRLARLRQPKDVTEAQPAAQAQAQPADDAHAYEDALTVYADTLREKGRPEAFIGSAIRSWANQDAPDRLVRLQAAIAEAKAAPAAPGMQAARNPDDKAPSPMAGEAPLMDWPTES